MPLVANYPKPDHSWHLSAFAWLGLAASFAPTLHELLGHAPAPLHYGGLAMFWVLYAIGAVSIFYPRPWGLVVLRLGSILALLAAIAIVVAADGLPFSLGLLSVLAVAATAALQFLPAVGDRQMDGASYPGERRFGLRAPREAIAGIVIAGLVPSVCLASILLALGAGGSLRWIAIVLGALTLWPSWLMLRQLLLLSRRWLIFAPRAIVVHDPYSLSEPISIPLSRVLDLSAAPAAPAAPATLDTNELLDLRAGYGGPWLQMLTDRPFEPSKARQLPARLASLKEPIPAEALGVAWPITCLSTCLDTARRIGLPTRGSAFKLLEDGSLVD